MSEDVRNILSKSWSVKRTAVLDEVTVGNRELRFRVQVSDEGRRPFMSRWFNDPSPAHDFIERIISGVDPKTRG